MKFTPKYMGDDDAQMIEELLHIAVAKGAVTAKVIIDAGDYETFDIATEKGNFETLDLLDNLEDAGIYFYAKDKTRLGWVYVVMGNGDYSVLADCYAEPWSNKVYDLTVKKFEKFM